MPQHRHVDSLEELSLPNETWKPVIEAPGYWVSDCGRVVTQRKGDGRRYFLSNQFKLLSLSRNKPGRYPRVWLRNADKKWSKLVHIIVLETFVGFCPPGMECRHLDDNPSNNALSNLCWGTQEENREDARRNEIAGRCRRGFSKLTPSTVLEVWQRYAIGELPAAIAELYNVSAGSIYNVVNGKTWTHIKP